MTTVFNGVETGRLFFCTKHADNLNSINLQDESRTDIERIATALLVLVPTCDCCTPAFHGTAHMTFDWNTKKFVWR